MNNVIMVERTRCLDSREKVIYELNNSLREIGIDEIEDIGDDIVSIAVIAEFDFDDGTVSKTVQTKIKKRGKMITIHIPENGRVAKFDVDPNEYDVDIWQIDEEVAKISKALQEMITITGATHQGRIKFKNGKKGSIEELNKIIEFVDQGDGVAFYSIIKD